MEIKNLTPKDEDSEEKIVFSVDDIDPSYANTLRRIMMHEVPTMAIEDVEFRKNSSILYDEIISHRLGLIPLTTDLKSYNLPSECKCKGALCASCSVKMTLKAQGPGYVYASELKSKDPAVKPVFGKIPITKLLEGQELELEATAVLGQGKEHAKWNTGLVFYKINKDEKENEQFIFTVESFGQLTPKEIVLKAIEIYDKQLDEFAEAVKNIE